MPPPRLSSGCVVIIAIAGIAILAAFLALQAYVSWMFRGAQHREYDDYGLRGKSPQACLLEAKKTRDPDKLLAVAKAMSDVRSHYGKETTIIKEAAQALVEFHEYAETQLHGNLVDLKSLKSGSKVLFSPAEKIDLGDLIKGAAFGGLVYLRSDLVGDPNYRGVAEEINTAFAGLEPPDDSPLRRLWESSRKQLEGFNKLQK